MLDLVWRLIKIWGGRALSLVWAFVKARIVGMLWKFGSLTFLVIITIVLGYLVLR